MISSVSKGLSRVFSSTIVLGANLEPISFLKDEHYNVHLIISILQSRQEKLREVKKDVHQGYTDLSFSKGYMLFPLDQSNRLLCKLFPEWLMKWGPYQI